MSGDNKDRYGYRHRRDSSYGMGESMPGDTGESRGTFYDRASSDNNIIVDGRVEKYESHVQNRTSKERSKSQKSGVKGKDSELAGKTLQLKVERISGSGNPIATYHGKDIHIPGGKIGESYKAELTAKSGYYTAKIKNRV